MTNILSGQVLGQMSNAEIIDAVLKYEGGFVNDPADHGGATNFGITAADYGRWKGLGRIFTVDEVKSMTVDEARQIYEKWYIDTPGFDAIQDNSLKWVLVDSGVLHGTRTSIKWLQQVLGVTVDGVMGRQTTDAIEAADTGHPARGVLALRINRYTAIVQSDATQIRFLRGWISRATSILQAI